MVDNRTYAIVYKNALRILAEESCEPCHLSLRDIFPLMGAVLLVPPPPLPPQTVHRIVTIAANPCYFYVFKDARIFSPCPLARTLAKTAQLPKSPASQSGHVRLPIRFIADVHGILRFASKPGGPRDSEVWGRYACSCAWYANNANGGFVVVNSVERLVSFTQATSDEVYNQFISLLTDMVEGSLERRKRIFISKPNLDWDLWLRRHILREELAAMDREGTARLLGTDNFVRIA